jgi:hypothetical protein
VVGEKSDSLTSYAIAPAGGKLRQYPIGKNCSEIVTLP